MSNEDTTPEKLPGKGVTARKKSRYGLDDQAFMAMWCNERAYRLNAYEQDFVDGMYDQLNARKPLSERQERFLEKIYRSLGGDGYPNTRIAQSRMSRGVDR